MPRSKTEIYLHMVWATRGREAFLTDDLERDVYRCIAEAAGQMGCSVLAIGGLPDHVHLAVEAPGTCGAADLAKRVKAHPVILRINRGICPMLFPGRRDTRRSALAVHMSRVSSRMFKIKNNAMQMERFGTNGNK